MSQYFAIINALTCTSVHNRPWTVSTHWCWQYHHQLWDAFTAARHPAWLPGAAMVWHFDQQTATNLTGQLVYKSNSIRSIYMTLSTCLHRSIWDTHVTCTWLMQDTHNPVLGLCKGVGSHMQASSHASTPDDTCAMLHAEESSGASDSDTSSDEVSTYTHSQER